MEMMAIKATNCVSFLILFLIIPSLTIVLTTRDFATNVGDPTINVQYRNEDNNFERTLNGHLPTTNYGSTLNYADVNPVPINQLAINRILLAAIYGRPLPLNPLLGANNYNQAIGQSYHQTTDPFLDPVYGANSVDVQRPPLPVLTGSRYNPLASIQSTIGNVNYGQGLKLTPAYAAGHVHSYEPPSVNQRPESNGQSGLIPGVYGNDGIIDQLPLPYGTNNVPNVNYGPSKELPTYVPTPCADLGSAANASFCCSATNGRIDNSGINKCCLVSGSSCSTAPNMCCNSQVCKAIGSPASGVHVCSDPNYGLSIDLARR